MSDIIIIPQSLIYAKYVMNSVELSKDDNTNWAFLFNLEKTKNNSYERINEQSILKNNNDFIAIFPFFKKGNYF